MWAQVEGVRALRVFHMNVGVLFTAHRGLWIHVPLADNTSRVCRRGNGLTKNNRMQDGRQEGTVVVLGMNKHNRLNISSTYEQ